jgi:hypothetical protein
MFFENNVENEELRRIGQEINAQGPHGSPRRSSQKIQKEKSAFHLPRLGQRTGPAENILSEEIMSPKEQENS